MRAKSGDDKQAAISLSLVAIIDFSMGETGSGDFLFATVRERRHCHYRL